MSAAELARRLEVPTNRITEILNGQRGITGDTALCLAHFFGTSAQFWLNLQNLYELRLAEKKAGKSIRALPTLKHHAAYLNRPCPTVSHRLPVPIARQVTFEITCVMENADHIDHVLVGTAAVDDEVAGAVHGAEHGSGAVAAEYQMIGANAPRQFHPFPRAWALGISHKVTKGLYEQCLIAHGGVSAKLLPAPFKNLADVAPCRW